MGVLNEFKALQKFYTATKDFHYIIHGESLARLCNVLTDLVLTLNFKTQQPESASESSKKA